MSTARSGSGGAKRFSGVHGRYTVWSAPPRDLAEEVAALEPQVVVVDPRHGPRILADRLRVEAEALDGSVAPARHRERPPVGLDEHGAVAVGAIDARADGAQPRERAGVWMAVQVARPDGDDGHRGPDGGEERRGTGRGGAVMADLEHRRAERDASLEQGALARRLDVRGQQHARQ